MFKRNQIQKTLVLAGVTLASAAVFAQQTETTTASVLVQNAFTLTEVDALSFGSITATVTSGGNASEIVLRPDGTAVAPTGDFIRVLTAGAPATYTIAGAAPFTDLTITIAEDTVDLTNTSAPGDNPDFVLSAFTVSDGTATASVTSQGAGATFSTTDDSFTTDVNGAMNLSLGGTLTLADQASATLIDGTYEGQFTMTVQY